MTDSLTHLRVLVTRPQHQAKALLKAIDQAGAQATALPLIQICAIEEGQPSFQTSKNHIMDLDLFQHVIFISPNAATYGTQWIEQYWPQLPIGLNYYAIGKATAAVLSQYDIEAYHCPQGYDSEALLTCPELQILNEQKVLIIRGAGGRAKLGAELSARGAVVSYAEFYQRRCPNYPNVVIAKSLVPAPDIILISSGEGLNNLTLLMQQAGITQDSLANCQLVVPSLRIKDMAEKLGFGHTKVALGPDDQAMLDTIKQL